MLHSRRLSVGASAAVLLACAGAPPLLAPEVRSVLAPEVQSVLAPTGTLRTVVYPGSPTSLVRGPGPQEMRGLAAP